MEQILEDLRQRVSERLPRILQDTELALAQVPHDKDPRIEAQLQSSLRSIGGGVQAFTRIFLAQLEASLTSLRPTPRQPGASKHEDGQILTLALLDDDHDNDTILLDNLASRIESRNSLDLQLLGHRFGVLAGAPAFEGERLPLGPHAFCHALSEAVDALSLSQQARRQLLFQFERVLVDFYPELLAKFNATLVGNSVLPHLRFIPMRVGPAHEATNEATPPASDRFDTASATLPQPPPRPPVAATPQQQEGTNFEDLQALLQRRRDLLNKLRPATQSEDRERETLPRDEVLGTLQRMRNNATHAATISDYRQIMLAQARQAHGHGVKLSGADADSFELLEQLLTRLGRETRKSSPGEALMERLSLPLAQLVLRDQTFFTNAAHPARQLLAAISLAGAKWLADDDLDNQWLGLLQRAVSAIQQDTQGACDTFSEANQALQSGLQAMARKTAMAERRQVEAARGREKMEQARLRASEELARLINGRQLSRFQQSLLDQAWTDVLSLTYLRSGEDSAAWKELVETGARIIDASTSATPLPPDPVLLERIRSALEQVGYHSDDARAVALQFANGREEGDDTSSRTELLLQLRARARLGEGTGTVTPVALPPRTTAEQIAYERLRALDGPVWVEFCEDPEQPRRRRLIWIGTRSGQALMVNRRGMRAGNDDLDTLARKLAAGKIFLLDDDAPPAETAWATTLGNLRQVDAPFAGTDKEPDHGA